jgi:hypothetical protein
MDCDRERLSYYLDGELSPEEVRQLEAHLRTCECCAADLAAYRRVEQQVGRLPANKPPSELARRLYRSLEERNRSRLRWVRAHPVLAPAIHVTAVFVVAAAAAGGLFTYASQRTATAPMMTAAFVVQEAPDSLDGLRIELVFDRAVAPDSLPEAISIEPPLPLAHHVQDNRVELTPQAAISPGAIYRLMVNRVRDLAGRAQSDPVIFSLSTGPTATLVQESTPAEPHAQSVGPNSVASEVDSRQAKSPDDETSPPAWTAGQVQSSGPEGASLPGASRSLSVVQPTLAGTALRDGSSAVSAYPELQRQLGYSSGPERRTHLTEQAFQGGAMLVTGDTNQVIVLVRSSGRWVGFPNPWRPGEVLASAGARPPGTLEPLRGFGKVWREQPAVKLQLGWPVYEERSAPGRIQAFENGTLLRSSYDVVYALFNDSAWRSLPAPRL